MAVGSRPGDLRHADEQPIPAGPDRRRGLCGGVRSPEQCTLVTLHRLLPPRRRAGHCDQGGDRDPVRTTRDPRARRLHPPASAAPRLGGGREHRRARHRGVDPQRLRGGIADCRDPALFWRGQLAGQPVQAPSLAPGGALRDRCRRDRGAGLHSRIDPVHRGRTAGASPARHSGERHARHAGRGRPGAGERTGPFPSARHEHGRSRLRTADLRRESERGDWPEEPQSVGCS